MDFVLSGNFKAVKHIHYAKNWSFHCIPTNLQTLPSGYQASIRLLILYFLDGVLLEM